jgi:hypothetical protein
MNEKHALCYDGFEWKVVDKDELAENIYENKRSHIIEKCEDFSDQLTETQQKALNRWFKSKDDKDDKLLKEDIKRILYEKRHLAMDAKKKSEKKNKGIQSLYNDDIKKIERKKYIPKKDDEN